METNCEPKVIGRIDKADFPEINLKRIRVKIDTGAYTSAIHCCKIEESTNQNLNVVFLDPDDPKYTGKNFQFSEYFKKSVKSSNGETEDRFVVSTEIRFYKELYIAEFSLTFRGDMRNPVLIGRKFLAENNFIVDPNLFNHQYKMKRAERLKLKN